MAKYATFKLDSTVTWSGGDIHQAEDSLDWQVITLQACNNCRAKKAKCTGEREGCRRCKKNKKTCQYAETARAARPVRKAAKNRSVRSGNSRSSRENEPDHNRSDALSGDMALQALDSFPCEVSDENNVDLFTWPVSPSPLDTPASDGQDYWHFPEQPAVASPTQLSLAQLVPQYHVSSPPQQLATSIEELSLFIADDSNNLFDLHVSTTNTASPLDDSTAAEGPLQSRPAASLPLDEAECPHARQIISTLKEYNSFPVDKSRLEASLVMLKQSTESLDKLLGCAICVAKAANKTMAIILLTQMTRVFGLVVLMSCSDSASGTASSCPISCSASIGDYSIDTQTERNAVLLALALVVARKVHTVMQVVKDNLNQNDATRRDTLLHLHNQLVSIQEQVFKSI